MANYTDEQIKKALYVIIKDNEPKVLNGIDNSICCININLAKAMSDLINRQEAEIEALNAKADKLKDECATLEKMYMSCLPTPQTATSEHERTSRENILCKEIERLKHETTEYPNRVLCSKGLILTKSLAEYDELINDISSEAIKEFAERLKEAMRVDDDCDYDCADCCYVCKEDVPLIDNLVREMVGEGE